MGRSAVGRGGGVSIQVEPPLEFIIKQTGEFQAALMDLEPLWELVKPVAASVEDEQFSGAGAWPPLADSTLAYKAKHEYPADPLVRTGDLKESLINPGIAADTGPRTMTYGTEIEYAVYHQNGTRRMPQRQVIPDPYRVEDRRKVEMAMITYVNSAARLTFGRI